VVLVDKFENIAEVHEERKVDFRNQKHGQSA
jgi:hypothetical protein